LPSPKAATRDRPELADRSAIDGQLRCCSAETSEQVGADRPAAAGRLVGIPAAKQS